MHEKLKSFVRNDTYFTVIIILLVGIASFGLGRMSMTTLGAPQQASNSFQLVATEESANNADIDQNRPVVASKTGTKYHLFDCPGALQMKEENRIEFNSIKEAQAAGYTPAGNCPGI